jgi:hypothetical protein
MKTPPCQSGVGENRAGLPNPNLRKLTESFWQPEMGPVWVIEGEYRYDHI